MTQTYTNFNVVEQGGQQYIIGQPKSEHEEPVRFSGEIEVDLDDEEKAIEATFRDVIKSLIQQDLSGALNLNADSGGTISREEAIKTLQNAEASPVTVQSQDQAEAIIDYFIDNDVLHEDGSEVVILSDPDSLAELATPENDADSEATMILNWMSAIEGCTSKIDETIETVEQVEDELREQVGDTNVTEKIESYESKQKEVAQQIMNLTNGGELDKSDLSASEQSEYDRLEKRLFHLDAMKESISDTSDLEQQVKEMTNDLAYQVKNLKDTKTSLDEQHGHLKNIYTINEEIEFEKAKQMADHLSSVASAVAGVSSGEERAENQDGTEFAQELLNSSGDIEQMSQEAPDIDATGREQTN